MSQFGDDLIASLSEAVAHARREANGVKIHTIDVPDIKAIRHQLNMSQETFAVTYRIPLATLKNWEQGRRQPDAPAMAYLTAISRKPNEIGDALKQ